MTEAETARCFQDLTGIARRSGKTLDEHRFAHVFVESRTYPYYQHKRNALIGVTVSGARKPSGTEMAAAMNTAGGEVWRNMQGSGSDGHVSIIFDFGRSEGWATYGELSIEGISVRVNRDNFAFFMTPEHRADGSLYYAHALQDGVSRVATLVDNEERFFQFAFRPFTVNYQASGSGWTRFPWRSELREKFLHVVAVGQKTVSIAGQERTMPRYCREEERVLAVTNSDALVGLIEGYLERRAPLRRGANAVFDSALPVAEFRDAFDALPPRSWIPVMTIPADHAAEHEVWNNLGHVQLVFTRDPERVFVRLREDRYGVVRGIWIEIGGEIVLNGGSLGRWRRCVEAVTPGQGQYSPRGHYVKPQRYESIRLRSEAAEGCRTRCQDGTCRLDLWKSKVPADLVDRFSEAKVESMKKRQRRIDVVNDLGASKRDWLDAWAGLEGDVMVPLLVVDGTEPERVYEQDHVALGSIRLAFEAGSSREVRSSMEERRSVFREIYFPLRGRLTVAGVAFDLPSGVEAVVEFKRRDDKALYGEIRKGRIEAGRLKSLLDRKSVDRIRMENIRSSAYRVICRGSVSEGICTVFASKREIEGRLGPL